MPRKSAFDHKVPPELGLYAEMIMDEVVRAGNRKRILDAIDRALDERDEGLFRVLIYQLRKEDEREQFEATVCDEVLGTENEDDPSRA
jgi:hypothetical protein